MATRTGPRDELGAADVTDPQLAAMVADLLHEDEVELLDVVGVDRSTTTCPPSPPAAAGG